MTCTSVTLIDEQEFPIGSSVQTTCPLETPIGQSGPPLLGGTVGFDTVRLCGHEDFDPGEDACNHAGPR